MDTLFYRDGVTDIDYATIQHTFPNVSMPTHPDEAFIRSLGYLPVIKHPRPLPTELQTPVPDNKVVGNQYVHGWLYVNKDADTIAKEKKAKDQLDDLTLTQADVAVKDFMKNTIADLDAYMDKEVKDLAGAKQVIKTLAKVLIVLARRTY